MLKNKKILEICNFSSGISGVWTRVFEESKKLAKNNDVYVFSSDLENEKINPKKEEIISGIKIKRFPVKNRMGFALFFDFEKEALKLKPDIIICHGYRKPYLNKAIRIARKINAKIYLVTHAPFVERGLRNKFLEFIVSIYDKIYARRILNSFDKIIAITQWEIPYLINLGAKKEKIFLIPNGIPELFFSAKKGKEQKNKILFFGRINHIKSLETLILALSKINKKCELDLTGPGNKDYINKLKNLAKMHSVKLTVNPVIYDIREKIRKIDSCHIFVLPSKREGMPISLIEAMSRGKIVISSDTDGGKEIITDGQNGFLFKRGDTNQLANKIEHTLPHNLPKIANQAKKSVKIYSWDKLIKLIEKTINES